MKERSILMTTESVKAILDGRKTMTRRVIKPQPDRIVNGLPYRKLISNGIGDVVKLIKCPYGQVGDRLWVRETWATEKRYNHLKPSKIPDIAKIYYPVKSIHSAGGYSLFVEMGKVRSSMFMCGWMSRLTLEITGVRVERLQEISWQDCKREGVDPQKAPFSVFTEPWRGAFARLWDSLNAKRRVSWNTDMGTISGRGCGWDKNPWVWVIKFDNIGVKVK